MRFQKKFAVLVPVGVMIAAAVAAFPPPTNQYTNLKVLPKNISTKDLSRIMIDDFEDGLGVSCGFCHAEQKDSHKLDYASDEKPEKEIARMMMKMTLGINKKYFKMKHSMIGDSTLVINCVTCHNGQPQPAGLK